VAADPRTIMRALKAVAPPPSMGGYAAGPAPYIGPGPSPLVASYNEWSGAHAYGTNSALPRDWFTFLSGMFGPSMPIQPVPIDMPEPGDERPEPRRNQYPISWDLNVGMPGTEGWGKLADFTTLRTISDLYSVARQCIELRKAEIRGIGWDIAPTRQAAKAMRGDHKAAADFADRQAKAVKFFRKPDPDYADLSSWLNAILEDFFVTDAVAVYPHPPRAKKGGLFRSEIAGLDLIDGTLIKPLVNIRGGKPLPPSPAFQQYGWGVPRVDLMSLLTGQTPDMGEMVDEFSGDQLLYIPYSRRSWTVYGQSFIERAIVPVMTGIQKQAYQANFFAEGSIPGLLISAGDSSLTPSQLRELQDALNSLSGDQAWKHKIIVLPSGSKADPMRPGPLADDFDTLVQIETCMAFDVQPFELGIIPQLAAAAASSGTARQTVGARVDIRQRKSTIPILLFLKAAIFDRILQDVCGQWDMEFKWEGLDEDENVADLTQALVEQIGAGLLSIDEGRQLLGRDPWGLPITSDPGWATQWGGLVPLTGVTEATAQPLGGSPGPGGPGRAAARPGGSSGTVDLSTPGAVSRPGAPAPATVPRNRMSSAQRHSQAAQVTATQNNTGSRGTPAHSGARSAGGLGPVAARSPKVQAQQRQARKAIEAALTAQTLGEFEEASGAPLLEAQRHAIAGEVLSRHDERPAGDALRELGLLKSHLRRGGTVGQWAPRDLPGHVMAMIDQDMAAGLSADYACSQAREALSKGASGYSLNPRSGMISLDLPEGTLSPLPGGVDDHHITVVYLGPDVDDDAFGKAAERAREAAAMVTGPLTGTVGGIGSFPASASSDGKVPVFAQVSLPGAEVLRNALADLSASEHKDWRPHVTLAYQDEGDPLPAPVAPVPVTFTHLTVHRGTDVIRHPLGTRAYKRAKDAKDIAAAGLAVRAADTGRVLMLQRAADDGDPAGGFWEFPGGRLDPGETALDAARREWAEEVGVKVPDGDLDGLWNAGNGLYRGFVLTVASEDEVPLFDGRDEVDDPDGDHTEALAWWDPAQIKDNPAVRPELLEDTKRLKRALTKGASDLTDPNPVDPEHILSVMRDKFPEAALRWVPKIKWIGPVQIPHDRIDYDDVDSWRASREPGDVKHYVRQIKDDDEEVAPVIMVQPEDENKVIAVDGHHRTLAYRKLGQPVKAYVGFAGGKALRQALETHSSQYAGGDEKTGSKKSAQTPIVSTVHHPLGHEGLWHTPDKHVAHMQQLPARSPTSRTPPGRS
jgi:8-oxo-dGTP pyrophosphatase MutT (NUDIX family)/2'-5' RNA ligase